jgi:hypothetical protein
MDHQRDLSCQILVVDMKTDLHVCWHAFHLALSVKARQALFDEPIIDRLDKNVLHIPIMLDGVHVELLNRLRFQPSDSSALSLP